MNRGRSMYADEDEASFSSYSNPDDTTTDRSTSSSARPIRQAKNDKDVIGREETKAISMMRSIVGGILLLATFGVTLTVFYYLKGQQQQLFRTIYEDDAEKLFQGIGNLVHLTSGTADAFTASTVSTASASNQTWPFVTTTDYAVQASKIRGLCKAVIVKQFHAVETQDRREWENYASANSEWVDESLEVMRHDTRYSGKTVDNFTVATEIFDGQGYLPPDAVGPFLPLWQTYPIAPDHPPFNQDGRDVLTPEELDCIAHRHSIVISRARNIDTDVEPNQNIGREQDLSNYFKDVLEIDRTDEPFGEIHYPILEEAADISAVEDNDHAQFHMVGMITMVFFWRTLVEEILPEGAHAVVAVFANTCGQTFSYEVAGGSSVYLGPSDKHESRYDDLVRKSKLQDLVENDHHGLLFSHDTCVYTISVYPSPKLEVQLKTNEPLIFAIVAAMIFVFTSMVFLVYDSVVERRQRTVLRSAMRTSAIVSSLFPENVRGRLIREEPQSRLKENAKGAHKDSDNNNSGNEAPIADLFPNCTVMFGDICGFTSWSSVRRPDQVFTLLETIYGAFDELAKRRGVFKVETIGDSYVAVAGLPEPRQDHAVTMVKFARDCRDKMNTIARSLEVALGPDTGDLTMRFGLNTGAVTAGVLRGEKSRFQLFGDTVNTAARMESTGLRNCIQISQTTYDQVVAAKKEHWCKTREEIVDIKGKGKMRTFWANPRSQETQSAGTVSDNSYQYQPPPESVDRHERLVEWNVEVLKKHIQAIVAQRNALNEKLSLDNSQRSRSRSGRSQQTTDISFDPTDVQQTVLSEVVDVIEISGYKGLHFSAGDGHISERAELQLLQYVSSIAAAYRSDNAFHNFEHASHVTMSVVKLLTRIVAPKEIKNAGRRSGNLRKLQDNSYGIASDPMIQFACIFSALIHDVDHPGVPNAQLVKEGTNLAQVYKNKSVAEQNSVDIAWNLFMDSSFRELRGTICPKTRDLLRLRQLIINGVMATDVMDRDLVATRNDRWTLAFREDKTKDHDTINRKATIVMEHLIQASDVAHTMQHWQVYRKWNERLYQEQVEAFRSGRAATDPTDNWYESELGFLDYYIIPLAKKLAQCGVFGVSSHEYLDYATKNRNEWHLGGKEIVEQMRKSLTKKRRMSRVPLAKAA